MLNFGLIRFLRNDVDVDCGCIAEKSVDGVEKKKFSPTLDGGSSEDHLRDVFFTDELCCGIGDTIAL